MSLAPFLDVTRQALSKELVPDADFARLRKLTERLPPAFGFIYECWLGYEKPDVDIQFYFRAGEGGALGEAALGDNPTWRAVQRVFSGFTGQEGLWLEFDLGDKDPGEADPRLGFAFAPVPFEDYYAALLRFYELLGRKQPADKELLRRCYEAFPEGCYLYGTGTGEALRWCVSLREKPQAAEYLKKIGWAHPLPPLDFPGLKHLALALDFTDKLGPRLGVEYYFEQDDFEPFLRGLAAQGLCNERWIVPFLASRGLFTDAGAKAWPEPLKALSELTGRRTRIHLNPIHVKVVYEAGKPVAAKAYVYGTYS